MVSTNTQQTNSKTQDKLLVLKGIEFACIINKHGRIEQNISNNAINLPKEKIEMFSMGACLQNSMQNDYNEEFGKVNYNITVRENSKFVSIPVHAGILLAKLDKASNPIVIVNKIMKIVKRW